MINLSLAKEFFIIILLVEKPYNIIDNIKNIANNNRLKFKFFDIMYVSFIDFFISLIIISAILIISLSGKYFLDKSKQLSFIREIKTLTKQNHIFKQKYKYYAGDYPFAKNLWQENFISGDGDGYIKDDNESLYAWYHLEKAELTKLNFLYEKRSYAKILYNMPRSKYLNCGYQILADRKLNKINFYFPKKKNFLRIALDKNFGNLSKSCIATDILRDIDLKIDDGSPVSGDIFADTGYGSDVSKDAEKCVCKEKNNYFYCKNNNINCMLQIIL